MDTIAFNSFKTVGVLGSDTFETWRQKTNGVVSEVDTISSNYVSRNAVLLLNSTPQTVSGLTTFGGGIVIGGAGGSVPISSNSSNELVLTNNVVLSGKNLSAQSLISTSPTISIGGESYVWPTGAGAGDGYLYHEGEDLIFKNTQEVVNEVLDSVGQQGLTYTQELTPVGAIIEVSAALPSIEEGLWLNCDGGSINSIDYPDLFALIGATLPNLNVGGKFYVIKALPENVTLFSLAAGQGLTTSRPSGAALDINGGTLSLKVNTTEFDFNLSDNGSLILKTGGVSYTKLNNADTSVITAITNIPLRDSSGYVRGNTPGVTTSASGDGAILVNKAYADGLTVSKDHKFIRLNGRGFNSYGVMPHRGMTCVDYDKYAKVFGENGDLFGRRFGQTGGTDAYGHSLPPYDNDVSKIYVDDLNTYVLYNDGKVYSHGFNTTRKTGNVESGVNTSTLNGPRRAFGSELISEIILSYDADAGTAYALNTSHDLLVAGRNDFGQLGLNVTNNNSDGSILPQRTNVKGKKIAKAWLIGGGNTQTGYALAQDDGTLWACGYGLKGQIGRGEYVAANYFWLPVLNPESSNYVGGTTTYASGEYTSTNAHALQDYDIVISGVNKYVVEYVNSNKFKLHPNANLNNAGQYVTSFSPSTQILQRLSNIENAYFGGTGSNTFAYAKLQDGTLYSWGYNGFGQLGLSDRTNRNIPTPVLATQSSLKATNVYTGLDDTVHFIGNNGYLYACGNNANGELGIAKNGGFETIFKRLAVENLDSSGLNITGNEYSVYRFFSTGTNSRFCIFQSGTHKKLTAWGSDSFGKLGADRNANSYNKPQNVYIKNDEYVSDVQTCTVANGGEIAFILVNDPGQSYGDMYSCGYHWYNFNGVPNGAKVPFFSKVKKV